MRMTELQRLSVLAVSPVAEAGGAETLLVSILAGLQGLGTEVALLALGDGPLAELATSSGVPALSGPELWLRRPRSVIGSAAAIRKAVGDLRPDVVLSSHPKGQLISRLCCLGNSSVSHITQLYDPLPGQSLAAKLAVHLPGMRLAITEETAASYRKRNQKLSVVVIPPATDRLRLLQEAERGDGNAAWVRSGLDGDGPRLVMVARLQRFKGPFDLIEAAGLVVHSRPDVKFLIIGPDSPVEDGLRDELSRAIRVRNLEGSVALAGRLSGPDLAATVRGSALLVHPARREPFGLAIVEALALGTPVVAYASTGPRLILGGGGGALVPLGDIQALAAAVIHAIDDPEVMKRWKADCETVASQFDLSANIQRYFDVLSGLRLARGKRTAQPKGGQCVAPRRGTHTGVT